MPAPPNAYSQLPYLNRQREDTIRCIVSSFTDDTNSELFAELGRGKGLIELDESDDESGDDEDDDDGDAKPKKIWMPDPVDAAPRMFYVRFRVTSWDRRAPQRWAVSIRFV